ncbi:MAG TPA: 5-formyltetrahydrofolate cyclo-ligase [Phycisphaerales bacterium]|nr:5-formyltetrahydrofolate cyclo-ligase [Phycisphaerales bacterium]
MLMTDSIEDAKSGLRGLVRKRLAAMTPEERGRLSGAVCERALAWEPLARAASVLAYAPMRSEVDIEPLIQALLARGVVVCIPSTDWSGRAILPVPITDLRQDLGATERGVRQPRATLQPIALEEVELFLVPGLAFDALGGRLGRGGGFYDRVLGNTARRGPALGLAFEAQVLEHVPMEAHDQRVDALATCARLIDCRATDSAGDPG